MDPHEIGVLKAVLGYMSTTDMLSWEEVKRRAGSKNAAAIDAFKRHGASLTSEAVKQGAEATAEVLNQNRELWEHRLPRYLARELEGCSKIDGSAQGFTTPFFLDEVALERFVEDGDGLDQLLSHYEGVWRLYRPSSNRPGNPAVRRLNRAVLSIHPRFAVKKRANRAPTFTLRGAKRVKSTGGLYRTVDRIFGVGSRTAVNNKSVTCLTWHDMEPDGEERFDKIERGIVMHSNTGGTPFVSHFIAKRIPGTHALEDQAYQDLKTAESEMLETYCEDELIGEGLVSRQEVDDLFGYSRGSPTLTLFDR